MKKIHLHIIVEYDDYYKIKIEYEILKIKKDNRKIWRKKIKKKIIFLFDLGLLSLILLGSWKISKKIYKTTIITYDTNNPEIDSTIEYLPDIYEKIRLTEYSPWEEPRYFRDVYKRNVYNYNLRNIAVSYDNIKDYLNQNTQDEIIVNEKFETSMEKLEEEYTDNKYLIIKITQDKNDFRYIKALKSSVLVSSLLSSDLIAVDILLFKKLSKTTLKALRTQKKKNKHY